MWCTRPCASRVDFLCVCCGTKRDRVLRGIRILASPVLETGVNESPVEYTRRSKWLVFDTTNLIDNIFISGQRSARSSCTKRCVPMCLVIVFRVRDVCLKFKCMRGSKSANIIMLYASAQKEQVLACVCVCSLCSCEQTFLNRVFARTKETI